MAFTPEELEKLKNAGLIKPQASTTQESIFDRLGITPETIRQSKETRKEQRYEALPTVQKITNKIADFTGGKEISQGIGQALAQGKTNEMLDKAQEEGMRIQGDLIKRIRAKKDLGEDTTRLENALKELGYDISREALNRERTLNPNELTTKEVLGDALQLGATAVGGKIAGKIAGKATSASGVVKGALQGAKVGALTGAPLGAVEGVAQGLQENEDAKEIGMDALKGVGVGALFGGALGALTGGISGGIKKYIENKSPFKTGEEAFDAIKPKLTTKEVTEKAKNNLISFDKKGNYIEKPSPEELRLSNIAKDIFSPKQSTGQKIGKVQEMIGDISENEVAPLLKNSTFNGSLDDVYTYIDQIQPTKQFAKQLNPTAYKSFNVVKNDAKDSIANALKKEMAKNPEVNFNEALWRSRQKIDDIIEDMFGASAFDDPLKNAAREASVKARNAIQNFLVDSVSGRDMTLMAKARNIANETLKKGIKLPEGATTETIVDDIYRSLGGTTEIVDEVSKEFATKMKFLSDLYSIKDNFLAPRLGKEDFSALQRLFKKYPKSTKAAKYTGAVAGGALLGSLGVKSANALTGE